MLVSAAFSAAADRNYWQGHLRVADFTYEKNTIEAGTGAGSQYDSASLTNFSYLVYQNPEGIVRHELTSMSRNRGLEPGLDVRIFGYAEGYLVSYNKGGQVAYRSVMPLPGGKTSPLNEQQILGHRCRGVETRWDDTNGYVRVVSAWSPTDCDFRGPLLMVTKVSDQSGRLWEMRVEVITDLEEVRSLSDSLFRLPAGMKIQNIP